VGGVLYSLPENHLNGRLFLKLRNRWDVTPDEYFKLMNSVRPLFARDDFKAFTPGFYINYIRDNNTPTGALRLNYFTTDASHTIDATENFVGTSNDLAILKSEHADRKKPIAEYSEGSDPAELNFRNFLDANTRICLDMLKNFGEHSFVQFVAAYKFVWFPQRYQPKQVFEAAFITHSDSFKELSKNGLDSGFWNDLVRFHRENDFGLHFMVNLVTLLDDFAYGP
jgi:hypothetical protein